MSRGRRYRGRHRSRKGLKVFIAVLAVLVVLAGVCYFYVENHLVYGEDGSVSVDIPWLNSWRSEESPSPSPIHIIIDSPTPDGGGGEPSDEPGSPSPTPEPVLARHALYLPIDTLSDQAALDSLLQIGGDTRVDTFVLEVKADSGALGWASANVLAQSAGLSAAQDVVTPAIQKIRQAGFSVTLRVSCFKDVEMPRKQQSTGVKHNVGLNWLDNDKARWINPYVDEVNTYLCDLLRELVALHPDEILLDYVQFPSEGSIEYIDYGADAATPRYVAIEGFIAQAQSIVGDADIALSAVILPETATERKSDAGGQRLNVFAETFVRLYVPVDDQTLEAVRAGLTTTLGDELSARFVPMFIVPNNANPTLLETTVGLVPDGSWTLRNDKGTYAGLWP